MEKIKTIQDVNEVLQTGGFETTLFTNSVGVKIGTGDQTFTAVISMNNNHLLTSVEICKMGIFTEDSIPTVMAAALDANTKIVPFALAMITSHDDPTLTDPADYPLVLIDSIPTTDLVPAEIGDMMTSLISAILGIRTVLSAGTINQNQQAKEA